jgi:hypothetical protein
MRRPMGAVRHDVETLGRRVGGEASLRGGEDPCHWRTATQLHRVVFKTPTPLSGRVYKHRRDS